MTMYPIMGNSKSDVNDRNTCSSWLIYYVGSKNEDEFV